MRRFTLLLALAVAPASALAVPITIDVTGTVFVYFVHVNDRSPEDYVNRVDELTDLNVYGTVTFDSSAGPPPVFDDFADGLLRQGPFGTPVPQFVSASLTWANGTYIPQPIPVPPGLPEAGDLLEIANFGALDHLLVDDQYGWEVEGVGGAIERLRFIFQDNFIPDDQPPTGNEFPNLETAEGLLFLSSVVVDYVQGFELETINGYQLAININSAVVRPAAVPEPSPLVLLAGGLVMLGLVRVRVRARSR